MKTAISFPQLLLTVSLCIACSAHSVWTKPCADWPPSRGGVVGSSMASVRPCAVSHTVLPFISWWVFGFSLFGFCEQRCCERVCTNFYVSMFSVLMGTHPSQHRTARWHMATQVEDLKTRPFSKAAVCCLFPSPLRSVMVLLSRPPPSTRKDCVSLLSMIILMDEQGIPACFLTSCLLV